MLRLFSQRQFHFTKRLDKMVPFLLADIGEGITEVEVLEWHVKEGKKIQQFDRIAEVQSDKATVEITSRYDGIVKKIHYKKGDTAKVGTPLFDIDIEGEDELNYSDPSTNSSEGNLLGIVSGSSPSPNNTSSENPLSIKAMPGVRHFAKSHGIDISQVKPTGNSGQVTKEDVLKHATTPIKHKGGNYDGFELLPLSTFQKAMAKSMHAALAIPHFGYHDDINVDQITSIRADLVDPIETQYGTRVTPMAFYIKAMSLALHEFPALNSHFESPTNAVKRFKSHNICVAVDTEHGLAIPVIKGVQDLSIIDIAKELDRLVTAARTNKLALTDVSNGTITISNIGTVGGTTADPVIVAPQVAIVALGRTQLLPRFDKKMQIAPASILPISWSADHRVIDGATIAKFSQRWKQLIENPAVLLLLHLTQP